MTEYIYESPDNGKTVYRRKFGDYHNRELVPLTEREARIMEREKEIKKRAEVLNDKMDKFDARDKQHRIWDHCKALDEEMLKVEQEWHKKWEEDRKHYEKHGYYPEQRK